jgi:integrase
MALNLYRRHRRDCKAGHPEESRSGDFEERKKGWKRCDCPIFASGTLLGKFRRQTTGQWEWPNAVATARQWEAIGSWTGETPQPVALPAPKTSPARTTIAQATKAFLTEQAETAAAATQKKYRLLLKRLVEFSNASGYVMIDQWDPMDVRQFRSTWQVSGPTAARRMSMLKPFFEYCVSNEWITRNPARMVKNPKGRDASDGRNEQKLPFSDDELKRMYAACEKYGRTDAYKWTGDDLADFISLSIYTGLRISDVAQFHIDRMQPTGEILIRTTKAGTHVNTWVPEWLQDRIQARVKIHGPYIFGQRKTKDLDVIGDVWRRKLNKVWEMCGPWKDKPTPHRFRHTFARILLQKPGVTVRDVAELLGNTEDQVRKSYSAWVSERQARLLKVLKEAFNEKPKPRLITMIPKHK